MPSLHGLCCQVVGCQSVEVYIQRTWKLTKITVSSVPKYGNGVVKLIGGPLPSSDIGTSASPLSGPKEARGYPGDINVYMLYFSGEGCAAVMTQLYSPPHPYPPLMISSTSRKQLPPPPPPPPPPSHSPHMQISATCLVVIVSWCLGK